MKKYVYLILALASAGSALSAILLFIHYQPQSTLSMAACSPSLPGSCDNIADLPLSSIFGIPVAASGLVFYLAICFIILVADYADGIYYRFAAAVLLCAGVFAIVFDFVLASVLIVEKAFCPLCVMTYLISAAIAVTAFLWVRRFSKEDNISIPVFYKKIFLAFTEDNNDRRAVKSLLLLFIVMLTFSVISTERTMDIKYSSTESQDTDLSGFLERFYKSPAEYNELPPSSLVLGNKNAPVVIDVFIDFLCSACYKFYDIEKNLLQKYGDKIAFVYYHYPLDSQCNRTVKNTLFKNSCTASKALSAAADMGFFSSYIDEHFKMYDAYRGGNYSKDAALKNLSRVKSGPSAEEFIQKMNSPETMNEIENHIETAKILGIQSTPTFFLASRRIEGVPPVKYIEAVIEEELRRKR